MKYGYIFEVAAIAVNILFKGVETLNDCALTAKQVDVLFKLVSDIEKLAFAFERAARVVVAENATTTSEDNDLTCNNEGTTPANY